MLTTSISLYDAHPVFLSNEPLGSSRKNGHALKQWITHQKSVLQPIKKTSRIWQIVSLFTYVLKLLVTKIINCFQSIIGFKNEQQTISLHTEKWKADLGESCNSETSPCILLEPKREDQVEPLFPQGKPTPTKSQRELEQLFNEPVDYQRFHDDILSLKQSGELFFNNYNVQAYLKLNNHDMCLIEACQNDEEKELMASTAVYDAIVNLYLKRFFDEHPSLNDKDYLPALSMIALGIAIKLSYDDPIWNDDWNHLIHPSIELSKYIKMERGFLEAIHWNSSISEIAI